ncbi:hypothetical protein Ancab_027711 [Ancistrocladus abbreviatus]
MVMQGNSTISDKLKFALNSDIGISQFIGAIQYEIDTAYPTQHAVAVAVAVAKCLMIATMMVVLITYMMIQTWNNPYTKCGKTGLGSELWTHLSVLSS